MTVAAPSLIFQFLSLMSDFSVLLLKLIRIDRHYILNVLEHFSTALWLGTKSSNILNLTKSFCFSPKIHSYPLMENTCTYFPSPNNFSQPLYCLTVRIRVSIAAVKHHDQKVSWFIWLTLQHFCLSLKKVRTGTQTVQNHGGRS